MGMSTSRVILGTELIKEKFDLSKTEQKLILSCGAAAGVSTGFNAPISAVFFVLEIVQAAFKAESDSQASSENETTPNAVESLSSREGITSILLASVMSALVSRQILRDHLTLELSSYSLTNPFLELPLYLLLGTLSGVIAFTFSQSAKIAKDAFEGNGSWWTNETVARIPPFLRPVTGGLISGLVGLVFPQILFFGYETLNALLANKTLPTTTLLELLVVKMFTTAVSTGSGLVGGTFAPSLFLGGMLGASFHNIAVEVLNTVNGAMNSMFVIADVPAYGEE